MPPSPEDDFDEYHRHIPRDADGAPVYFILPAEVQAEYDQELASCEVGWRETADPAFIGEAIVFAYAYRQPVPRWLNDAMLAVTVEQRGQGHVARERYAAVHWLRYRAVCDARRRGLSWNDAWADAAEKLAGTVAEGEESTMKASYCAVQADLQDGRHGRYQQPLLPNEETRQRLGDVARRKPSPR